MKLKVEFRETKWKNNRKFRKEGKIPATVYSKHLEKPISIFCEKNEFVKLYRKAGHSTPIELTWKDIDELALIYDYQLDPVSDAVIHVDFLWIKKWVKVAAEVSIIMKWDELSPLVKSGDANIDLVKDNLEIEALPKDLPKEIVIDVSTIDDLNTVLFVKDLNLPKWVLSLEDWELPVITVVDLKKLAAQEEAKEKAAEEAATQETTDEDQWEKTWSTSWETTPNNQ